MTRHADPDTRRLQIAEALLRTLAERGLGGTTLADVAAAADVSVGLVQRYFRTKDELLIFGIEYVYQRATDRLHRVEIAPPVRDVVVRLMETFLPLDETRERELRVWLNFLTASLTSERMAAIHRAATGELIDGITDALTAAQRTGEPDDDLDPRAEATALVAFVDGLCLHHAATGDGYDIPAIRAALATYAGRLFGRRAGA
ncbi:TetR family transcriptional regulator [Spongiactinospora gelatinilytica]|uniref:TetR family transcriptional regulator n=1 Tax=Spongiactinospora gelatinilytica TaxID=2666298 RepID=A0A2W2I632_9ACTN|nr:TetR family transcriptional regulator C-terminal domain-containing protein [Spongiactinospora gelatinilytica]PZG45964.1 TetR family transcriptional regulator [Spongiactinospora gelatinilytica]